MATKRLHMCVVFVLLLLITISTANELDNIRDLSELPLSNLLNVKNSFKKLSEDFDNSLQESVTVDGGPQALPLKLDKKSPIRRGEYDNTYVKEGGSGKIKSLFNIAISSLAFLAFGGYLLCMIVQAIKNKGSYYPNNPNLNQPMVMMMTSAFKKKRKPSGRRRRDTQDAAKAPAMLGNTDDMYRAMIMLAEGFATYSQTT